MARAYENRDYRKARERLLAGAPVCAHCGRPATEADHQPPLSMHRHVDGSGCCRLVASCSRCGRRQGGVIATLGIRRPPTSVLPVGLPESTPAAGTVDAVGFDATDPCWDVPWLAELRQLPAEATWPRLMTPPHPHAVGSYGAEVDAVAAERGVTLRWWQRLAAARILEHDDAGILCWREAGLTVARQVGKSWLLRELAMWRIRQGPRWGAAQNVIHTAKDTAVSVEVQRAARQWAKEHGEAWKVREANGSEHIERLCDGSRWLIKAIGAPYGFTASLAVVDEAWAIKPEDVEEGIVPTLVEVTAGQLLLVSTAHRRARGTMVNRRNRVCADVAATGRLLWLEWSAPPAAALDDPTGWRAASPHWHPARAELVADRHAAAVAGEASDDPDEVDPVAAFASQWLNRWPAVKRRASKSEALVDAGAWADCRGGLATPATSAVIAVEDDRASGVAGVAVVASDAAGNVEVDGREVDGWETAFERAALWAKLFPNVRTVVGAGLYRSVPADYPNRAQVRTRGNAEASRAFGLFRELVRAGRITHSSDSPDLDAAVQRARVYATPAGALNLVDNGSRSLVKALMWALDAAAEPPPTPQIH